MTELNGQSESNRRGIYVHAMKDGTEFYAGLSIDVVARYRQHLQTYGTIEQSAFLQISDGPLDSVESDVIDSLRSINVTLLNVLVPSELVKGELQEEDSEVDPWEPEFYSSKEWEENITIIDETPPVAYDPKELPKFERRYRQFCESRGYSEEIMQFIRYFVRSVLPDPVLSQKNYWSINCLTEAYRKESETTLIRVTVNRPEIFAVHLNKDKNAKSPYHFVFTVAMLGGCNMDDLVKLQEIPGCSFTENPFSSARFKHVQMYVDSLDDAWAVLRNPASHRMLRQAAWALVNQGKLMPRFAQAHCLPLAEKIFQGSVALPAHLEAPTLKQVLDNPELDSVWMSNEDYYELILKLLSRAAAGDAISCSALLRHTNRFEYRSNGFHDALSFELMDKAFELAPSHPKLWEVMQQLSASKGPHYSAVGAYMTCALRPVSDSTPTETVKRFIAQFKGAKAAKTASAEDLYASARYRHEGTILAGIVHTGDRRILPLAEKAWELLDINAKHMFFRVFPRVASHVYVEFALNRLGECADDSALAEVIIRNLKDMPITLDEISLSELEFRFGTGDPKMCPVYNEESQTFASYAEASAEAIKSLSDDKHIGLLINGMLSEWEIRDDKCS